MALTTPSSSPAVSVREIDLTSVAPNVQSTTGAFVGGFKWGPVDTRVLVSNESELVSLFGAPSKDSVDFLSAAYFLKYSNSLFVVRSVGAGALNATSMSVQDSDGTVSYTGKLIKNESHWESQVHDEGEFYAKYPGTLGNSLKVTVLDSTSSSPLMDLFTVAPKVGEVHVVVEDVDGGILGNAGILETFEFLSETSGSKTEQGANNFVEDVINRQSQYVWCKGVISGEYLLGAGTDVDAPVSDYSLFSDVDTVIVDFLISSSNVVSSELIAIAENRKDCVVVLSPPYSDVVNNPNAVTDIVTWSKNELTNESTYAVVDCNWLKVYDKYNDQYVFIPAASSTAGLMAATDNASAPWFSPAGDRRGNYLGVTDLAYNPTKSERDQLYKVGINPIANIPGSGVVLYGDKTYVVRPSAFDRINVRRLFLVLERSISIAGKNVMFEFNDEFTRAEFVNIVEPLLREVQGRRGITDFRVVCDETNNTAAVVDRNEFVASIFIKPARSINFVTLNFVAVRTGVEFEEIVGSV